MWKGLKRSVEAPMRLIGMLHRICLLLEEQNNLLRELHRSLTGKWPLTTHRPISQTLQKRPATAWIRPSQTEQDLADQELAARERAAASVAGSGGSTTPSTDENGSTDLKPRPIGEPPLEVIGSRPT